MLSKGDCRFDINQCTSVTIRLMLNKYLVSYKSFIKDSPAFFALHWNRKNSDEQSNYQQAWISTSRLGLVKLLAEPFGTYKLNLKQFFDLYTAVFSVKLWLFTWLTLQTTHASVFTKLCRPKLRFITSCFCCSVVTENYSLHNIAVLLLHLCCYMC